MSWGLSSTTDVATSVLPFKTAKPVTSTSVTASAGAGSLGYGRRSQAGIGERTAVADAESDSAGGYVSQVRQEYDMSLATSLQGAAANRQYYQVLHQRYVELQGAFGTDGRNNLGDATAALADNFQSLAAAPDSLSARADLLSGASRLCNEFNQTYRTLSTRRDAISANNPGGNGTLNTQIGEVNRVLSQIAVLNDRIEAQERRSLPTQELRDERDGLGNELGNYINITLSENSNGRYSVELNLADGSTTLIDGGAAVSEAPATLRVNSVETPAGSGFYRPVITSSAEPDMALELMPESGSIAALLDARDYIASRLDDLYQHATLLANRINSLQMQGFDLSGAGPLKADGSVNADFVAKIFDIPGAQPSGGTVISVYSGIARDARKIAAAAVPNLKNDGRNAALASEQLKTADSPDGMSPIESSAAIGMEIAGDVEESKYQLDYANSVMKMFQDAVADRNAVRVDSDMESMLELQRAYQSAAKFMNVIDRMMGMVVNL